MKYQLIFILLMASLSSFSQNEIELRTDGLVLPRTTTDLVTDPTVGMLIYDISNDKVMSYDGVAWQALGPGCSSTGSANTAPPVDPMCCEEQHTFGSSNDNFGETVSIDVMHTIIGAPGKFPGGRAYIYNYDTSGLTWSFGVSLSETGVTAGNGYGESVDIDDDYAIVGVPRYSDTNFTQNGGAFIYYKNDSTWSSSTKLNHNDKEDVAKFGTSVAIDGNWAIVGAPNKEIGAASDQGKIYLFELINLGGNIWSLKASFTASDGESNYAFGSSVAIDGNFAIVGAPGARALNGNRSGKVYVFQRSGTIWGEIDNFDSSPAVSTEQFGAVVAISGHYFVAGEPNRTNKTGAVSIFNYDGSNWSQTQQIFASDSIAGDVFGKSVSMQGVYVIVGAPQKERFNTPATGPGKAYMFHYNGTTWNEIEILTDPFGQNEDQYGISVSTDSANRIIGSPEADPNGVSDKGKVIIGPVN